MCAKRISPAEEQHAAAFVREVIVLPWRQGGLGPDAYDCWGLVRAAQLRLAGRDLPLVNANPDDLRAVMRLVQEHPLRDEWQRVEDPSHLDVVTMSHRVHPHHIGVFLDLDGGVVLHACQQFRRGEPDAQKPGVVADTLLQLKISGWARIEFWRHPEAA